MQLPDFPLEKKVESFVSGLANSSKPETSGADKNLYLDLSEKIVRPALEWQDETGRIIDPFEGYSVPMSTARFVGACAGLILGGRGNDKLVDACMSGMDSACEMVSQSTEKYIIGAPAFYVKELVLGLRALENKVSEKELLRWKKQLTSYDLDKAAFSMRCEFDKQPQWRSPQTPSNGLTFLIAGEAMKKSFGIADNSAWIEKQMPYLPQKFTEFGMWRDSGDPMTYDWVPRMNLSLALLYGYKGKYAAIIDEFLRRGALTMLFYLSTTGEAPYGGRSSQNNHNEATIALICEYEANRYSKLGQYGLAGAFKRAARMAVLSIKKYLEMEPFRNTKNSFPPEKQHGREAGYGFYSVYSLLAASQLGIAYAIADENIEEAHVPQETCAYVISVPGTFHKIFASCGNYHLEFDTDPNLMYDALGLGRIHCRGFLSELGLSTSIVSHGNFLPLPPASERDICIGPGWTDEKGNCYWLSEFREQIEKMEVNTLKECGDAVEFSVSYKMKSNNWGCEKITERYLIAKDGVVITSTVEGEADGILFQMPLIESNGKDKSVIDMSDSSFKVCMSDENFKVECGLPTVKTYMEDFTASNRNGIYRIGCFKSSKKQIVVKLSFEKQGKMK